MKRMIWVGTLISIKAWHRHFENWSMVSRRVSQVQIDRWWKYGLCCNLTLFNFFWIPLKKKLLHFYVNEHFASCMSTSPISWMFGAHRVQRRDHSPCNWKYLWLWAAMCGGGTGIWGSPLKEQQVLITAEPSLSSPCGRHHCYRCLCLFFLLHLHSLFLGLGTRSQL